MEHAAIEVYLSAVRNLQISYGLDDPFAGIAMPQLDLVMRGIKRSEAEKGVSKREQLPIFPLILLRLKEVWSPSGRTRDDLGCLNIDILCLPSGGRDDSSQ